MTTTTIQKKFSIPSIISIISAILSFQFGAILGMLFALAAIVAGLFGVILALSPKNRGGITSIVALALGAVGVIAAIIKIFV